MNYYEILGVTPVSSELDIAKAYKEKIKSAHPDKGGSEKLMDLINTAYFTLRNPLKRKQYDEQLQIQQNQQEEIDLKKQFKQFATTEVHKEATPEDRKRFEIMMNNCKHSAEATLTQSKVYGNIATSDDGDIIKNMMFIREQEDIENAPNKPKKNLTPEEFNELFCKTINEDQTIDKWVKDPDGIYDDVVCSEIVNPDKSIFDEQFKVSNVNTSKYKEEPKLDLKQQFEYDAKKL